MLMQTRIWRAAAGIALITTLTGCVGIGANIGLGRGGPHIGVSLSGRVTPQHGHQHKHQAVNSRAFVRIEQVSTGVIHVPANGRTTIDLVVNSNTGLRLLAGSQSCVSTNIRSVGPGRQNVVVEVFGLNQRGNCRLTLVAESSRDTRITDRISVAASVY